MNFISIKNSLASVNFKLFIKHYTKLNNNKAIEMMHRKSPRSENIHLIENHCQANISK